MPSLDNKDDQDFSRAPGPQQTNNMLKNNASLIGQSDNTWSTMGSRQGNDGWPTNHSPSLSGNDDKSVNVDAWPSDLVPEFEPGKPWKGNQILKSVEDDPTLTPGSVVRSPLSLAIKDASEIFAKNVSPPTTSSLDNSTPLSLSSSTWSFTPQQQSGSGNMQNSMSKIPAKGPWDEMRSWDYGSNSVAAGSRPPPGLPGKKGAGGGNGGSSNPPTSIGQFNSYRNSGTNQSWGGGNGGQPHYWLLLRNLTPQIDGSTLRTLCLQHGPLQNFQLFLNHGIALVKYSTREEAPKAQNALNSCVLGNTTILAETASETDVHNLIQGLSGAANPQTSNSTGGYSSGNSGNKTGADNPWGVLRDNSPLWGSSPWGSSNMDAPDRATPSSLNSLLPGDLLGGESA